jgi:DNA-binding MarR family transcriptional regulator
MIDLSTKNAQNKDEVDLGELSGSLGFLLRLAQLQIFEDFFKALSKYDLKPGEFSVLHVLALNPAQRQGAIAKILRIKPAHMTKVIARLETSGFLTRTIPDDDRRSVKLSLTQKGDDFVRNHRNEFMGYFNRDQERLSDDELGELVALLKKYVRIDEAGS